MVGSRWNLDVTERLEFGETGGLAQSPPRGPRCPGKPGLVHYFVFSRTSPLVELPPFAVGRPRWDNWMIFRARSLGIPVTDATLRVDVVHQNHSTHVMTSRGPLPAVGGRYLKPRWKTRHLLDGQSSASREPRLASTECAREARSRASVAARFHPRSEP